MAEQTNKEVKEIKSHHGLDMTLEKLVEHQTAFKDIEDSIELVMKKGKDV